MIDGKTGNLFHYGFVVYKLSIKALVTWKEFSAMVAQKS
jgi:hypothetical protein